MYGYVCRIIISLNYTYVLTHHLVVRYVQVFFFYYADMYNCDCMQKHNNNATHVCARNQKNKSKYKLDNKNH